MKPRALLPFVPLAAGLVIVAAGFAYDIAFAGIPYQDPPPALQRQFDRDAAVASRIEAIGGYVTLAGLALVGITWSIRRVRRALR